MNLRSMPVRWKFTLLYAILLLACLFIFGAAIYLGTREQLSSDLDEEIGDRSVAVNQLVQITSNGISLDTSVIPGDDDRFVRVWNTSGSLVADTSDSFTSLPDFGDDVNAALAGVSGWVEFIGNGETLRANFEPIRNDGDIVGVILVAQSTGEIEETLAGLVRLLLIVAPFALIVAIVGGYLVAVRVLAPVVRITNLAASIDSRAMGQRLKLELPDDELGRLARTFDSMLDRIESAFERQRQFTGDAAHELRTPLGVMRSRIELALARPRSTEEMMMTVRELDRDLDRVTRLAGALLHIARLDSTGFQPESESFNLESLIRRVATQYQENPIEIVLDVTPITLLADEDLILQLLVNLMDNAVRHTPAGGTVTLGCATESGMVRMWIEDTGPGIPPELHQKVFDRFFRVDSGRTRQDGGVGLGLSISQAIVTAHRGTISVENTSPTGLRVTVAIPS